MIGRLKCKLGFHKGHPEAHGNTMYFHCTRCDSLVSPIELDPDRWDT